MKESATYQAILEEGRAEGEAKGMLAEAKKVLRLLGESRFGPLDAQGATTLESIKDVPRLEELIVKLPHVGSWQELLGPPVRRRGNGRRRPNP